MTSKKKKVIPCDEFYDIFIYTFTLSSKSNIYVKLLINDIYI